MEGFSGRLPGQKIGHFDGLGEPLRVSRRLA
jgi:hypothetical protein